MGPEDPRRVARASRYSPLGPTEAPAPPRRGAGPPRRPLPQPPALSRRRRARRALKGVTSELGGLFEIGGRALGAAESRLEGVIFRALSKVPGAAVLPAGAVALTAGDAAVIAAVVAVGVAELAITARAIVQAARLVGEFQERKIVDAESGKPIGKARFLGFLAAFLALKDPRAALELGRVAVVVAQNFAGGRWAAPSDAQLARLGDPQQIQNRLGRVRILP